MSAYAFPDWKILRFANKMVISRWIEGLKSQWSVCWRSLFPVACRPTGARK